MHVLIISEKIVNTGTHNYYFRFWPCQINFSLFNFDFENVAYFRNEL